MNKKLIAVAVAGVVAAPAAYADISAYGRIHNRIQITDTGTTKTENVNTTGSRFGFKGSSDLGNGMKAFARYEFSTNTDNDKAGSTGKGATGLSGDALKNCRTEDTEADGDTPAMDANCHTHGGVNKSGIGRRLGFVGLEGHFGKISLGQQWSAYYQNVGTYASPNIANGPGQQLGPFRTGNTIQYANSMGPVSFKIDGRVDDANDGGGNGFGFGATLSAIDNVTLGFGYHTNDTTNVDTIGASATVGFGILHLALSHEQQEVGMVDNSNTVVGLSARVASNLTLSAAFGQTEYGMDEEDRANASATYNFGGGLRAWVEAANVDKGPGDDTDYFAAGLRMDF